MRPVDPAAEQVEAQPAPFVLVLRLMGESRRGEGAAEIVGLHELCVGADLPDRAHGEHRRLALVTSDRRNVP